MTYRIIGWALVTLGITLLVVFQINFGAALELDDRTNTQGNIFEPQLAPVGIAGFVCLAAGIVVLVTRRRRTRLQP